MRKAVVIPRAFHHQDYYRFLKLDGISSARYHHYKDHSHHQVVVTTYLFVFVLGGKKIMHLANGDLTLVKGDAFFAKKDSYMYSEFIATDSRFQSLMFFIEDNFLASFLQANAHLYKNQGIAAAAGAGIFKIPISPVFKSGLESLLPYFMDDAAYSNELLQLKFTEILHHLVASDRDGNFLHFLYSIFSQRKKRLVDLMQDNFDKPLNIDDFARLSGRSLSKFKQDFKEVFQLPPKQWVNQKRLERAYSLLVTGESSVTDVCFDVGYENTSYFTQLFKKNFGLTPKQVRKSQNQQKNTFN